ncbi:MAG: TAXI family TRAP transporter solute-binding subunit [Dehalococcoidales bacterium]|nr:TAXI family TRAP transporter solute-binding subunit [Dehalococcoidales bacterium]
MKRCKYVLSISLVCIMILAVLLSGCSKAETAEEARAKWPTAISIGTGPMGQTLYVLGVGFGAMIEKGLNIPTTAEAGKASGESVQLMRAGQAEFGFITADAVDDAMNGRGMFKDDPPATFIRTVHGGHLSTVAWVATASSGIKTPADFKGKKVICDWPSSPCMVRARDMILDAYNLKLDDFTHITYISGTENTAALKEGRVDAAFYVGGIPIPAVIEVCTTANAVLVPVDKAESIVKKPEWSMFVSNTIPAGTYKGQDKGILTVALNNSFLTSSAVNTELIYEICKVLFDHPEELGKVHPSAKEYTLANAFIGAFAPYHDGAIKYYKERGVWTADMDKWQKSRMDYVKAIEKATEKK